MNAALPPLAALPFRLLNEYQHGFPLCEAPFAAIAAELGSDAVTVLGSYRQLLQEGRISRIGPVFAPGAVGASTLAAMRVPSDQLEAVAAHVNTYPEVNHNYEREHAYNLWFVVAAPNETRLAQVLDAIERQCHMSVLRLPLVEQYHVDLGFSLHGHGHKTCQHSSLSVKTSAASLTEADRSLIGALQAGLPLCEHPYQALADTLGSTQHALLQRLNDWLAHGVLKRFGVVVRHHEAGYTANAMVVHDVPDRVVATIGQHLGQHPAVTLCYRRPRIANQWPYNLFCMVHGRERATVQVQIEALRAECGLLDYDHAVLFSTRRFKQTGARYVGVAA